MVGSPDPLGISVPRLMSSFHDQWTVVSGEKSMGWGMGNPSGFLWTSGG